MGFDIMHLNLHKTFSTRMAAASGRRSDRVRGVLRQYLPAPPSRTRRRRQPEVRRAPATRWGPDPSFWGNFGVLLEHSGHQVLGAEGLRRVAENARVDANYLRVRCETRTTQVRPTCMHEVVLRGTGFRKYGVRRSMGERLMDYGCIHDDLFPLIVEARMIEPTSAEPREPRRFHRCDVRASRRWKIPTHPASPHADARAPLDEGLAARVLELTWKST